MTLYLDIIWLLNLLFDCLILLLTAIILKRKLPWWRIFFGGFIGSLLILLAFTPFNAYIKYTAVKFLFSICIVLATFSYHRFRTFVSTLATFYFVTFLLGGSLIGVHYFITFDLTNTSLAMLTTVSSFGDPLSWIFVIIGFPLSWHFARGKIESFEITKINYENLVNITVVIQGNRYELTGLIDSGNNLYDPLSNTPVMIVSLFNKQNEFPKQILKLAKNDNELLVNYDDLPEEFAHKIRLIPARVVGKEQQLLIAIQPDEVIINAGSEQINLYKILVSFTMQQLSLENSYECIVHPTMMIK